MKKLKTCRSDKHDLTIIRLLEKICPGAHEKQGVLCQALNRLQMS